VLGYQALSRNRIPFQRPDFALFWTPQLTQTPNQQGYNAEPFMNDQVAWDSGFYLSIAIKGYEDPAATRVAIPGEEPVSLNHAFLPLYPLLIRIVSVPLDVLGKNAIATATLAGVIIAIAGTIGATIALYDITRGELGETGGMRTAFYLLAFPSSFFFAQVYTEGLFVGLTFGALALIQRRNLRAAAVLAALAVWTRSVGGALVVVLAIAWLLPILQRRQKPQREELLDGLVLLLPVMSFLIWYLTFASDFLAVEKYYSGRGYVNWDFIWSNWKAAFDIVWAHGANSENRVYYGLEFASLFFALAASALTARRYPLVALFSLLVVVPSMTGAGPQSVIRYVLGVPSMFIVLSTWGRNPVFDRAWLTGSLMLMGLLAALFTQGMWVA
jgi:hypothetical protein